VVFTTDGQYAAHQVERLTPKSLPVAILQAVEYENSLGGMAYVIDLRTGNEVHFDRVYPYTIRAVCAPGTRHNILAN
jgi:hypothetical protein